MLGEKIQRLRKVNGLSQEELASQLTVSRQAISKWELGESVPDTENVVQLSKLFGVSTDYLLNDEYESDSDIPAVKISKDNIKVEYRDVLRKTSYFIIAIGLIGVIAMVIFSYIAPAIKMVPDSMGPPHASEFEFPYSENMEPESEELVKYYTDIEVRGDLGAFLDTFKLNPLFASCCVLTLLGFFLLFSTIFLFKSESPRKSISGK